MDARQDLDISLFGTWDAGLFYRGTTMVGQEMNDPMSDLLDDPMDDPMSDPSGDSRLASNVRAAVLETKSAQAPPSPTDDLRRLLNDMTQEMRAQFGTFRDMRESAAAALADGDDAAQKLARADVKAATDAMSLIVRTLEKIDALQRQLARDRDQEAERLAELGGYEEARDRLLRLIEDKAHARAKAILQLWRLHGPADAAEHRDAGGSAAGQSG